MPGAECAVFWYNMKRSMSVRTRQNRRGCCVWRGYDRAENRRLSRHHIQSIIFNGVRLSCPFEIACGVLKYLQEEVVNGRLDCEFIEYSAEESQKLMMERF